MKRKKILLPDGFTVTGHTGSIDKNGKKTPDNSLESIHAAVQAGADIVEIDLRFLADGTPVLSHNAVLPEEEKDLVRLDEAFAVLKQYPALRMNIDLKMFEHLDQVRSLAEKHGVSDRIFFTGVGADQAEAVRAQGTGIPYYINSYIAPCRRKEYSYLMQLIDGCHRLGGIGLNIQYLGGSKLLAKLCHKNGLLLSVWTCTRTPEIRFVLPMRPDNITSRNPALVRRLADKKRSGAEK